MELNASKARMTKKCLNIDSGLKYVVSRKQIVFMFQFLAVQFADAVTSANIV